MDNIGPKEGQRRDQGEPGMDQREPEGQGEPARDRRGSGKDQGKIKEIQREIREGQKGTRAAGKIPKESHRNIREGQEWIKDAGRPGGITKRSMNIKEGQEGIMDD